jgi:hypothetical protein
MQSTLRLSVAVHFSKSTKRLASEAGKTQKERKREFS